jgi:LysM repeat protein
MKNSFKKYITSLLGLFLFTTVIAQEINETKITSDSFYFIDNASNVIQYNNIKLMKQLNDKWQLKNDKFTIAHFGDSHVQLDHFVTDNRKYLQQIKRNAGRGMIFPFAIAKTYSHTDYTSKFSGTWTSANSIQTPPKIPVGISGFVATTKDTNASFCFYFKVPFDTLPKTIKLYYRNPQQGYKLKINSANVSKDVLLEAGESNYISVIQLDKIGDSLFFQLQKDSFDSTRFSLHGVSIENKNTGLIYHNFGVGGASYSALLHQTYFDEQIKSVNPDLVILDWGTNDIIYTNIIADDLTSIITNTISKVKANCPNAVILLTTVQDMNYKGKNIDAAPTFSKLIKKIAVENDCLLYDWYTVSGGRSKMKTWESLELGRKDNIHLTAKGYQLKAKLFSQAIINSINSFEIESVHLPVILLEKRDTITLKTTTEKKINKNDNQIYVKSKTEKQQYHVVKKGEKLETIAKKYKVSVDKLKKQNNIKSNKINIGQKLIIKKT